MKKIYKAYAPGIATPALAVTESGPLVCSGADEEAIIRAYRDMPPGGVQQTIMRFVGAMAEKFGTRGRPRLSLVVGSKGIPNE